MTIALKEIPNQILELENACKEKNHQKVNIAAHTLKGSSSSMRFSLMAKILEKIESLTNDNWNENLALQLSALNAEWEIIKKIIHQKIN
jgi:HPt (histidine-containing phosphotransfer) domain-containing protein